MSLTSALHSAASGLGAVARATEVLSSNIANASTNGYGRRELLVTGQPYSGGVRIDGVGRMVNASVLGESRLANAGAAHAATIAAYYNTMERAIGVPGNEASITDRVAAFESALIRATASPDSDIRLRDVLAGATDLVRAINRVGTAVQTARQGAENDITRDVAQLNTNLAEVARLNRSITVETMNGRDTSSLKDARQRAIDDIATLIPLREVVRDYGSISLYTAEGAALLDGTEPALIAFTPTPQIGPQMKASGGQLNYLTVDDRPLSSHQMDLYAGGRLAAAFAIRAEHAPALQALADQLAQDLANRLGNGGPDPTIGVGAAGLFTDNGAPLGTPLAAGLAQRLAVNADVDPNQGGDLWRLRDGIYAALPGDQSDAALIGAMVAELQRPLPGSAPLGGGAPRSLGGLAGDISSSASTARVRSETKLAAQNAHDHALRHSLAVGGVDTDAELQHLLTLEQAYAANARVIRAADSMLNTLLEI